MNISEMGQGQYIQHRKEDRNVIKSDSTRVPAFMKKNPVNFGPQQNSYIG